MFIEQQNREQHIYSKHPDFHRGQVNKTLLDSEPRRLRSSLHDLNEATLTPEGVGGDVCGGSVSSSSTEASFPP
jgi:hypothetical protein